MTYRNRQSRLPYHKPYHHPEIVSWGHKKKFTDICDAILQFLPILCIIKRITKNCYMGKRQKKAPDWFGLDEDRFTEAMAKVIQRHRAAIGISRDRLAFELNLHKNTLYGVEVGVMRKSGNFGRTQLTMLNFIHMAAFFKIDPGELLKEILEDIS